MKVLELGVVFFVVLFAKVALFGGMIWLAATILQKMGVL